MTDQLHGLSLLDLSQRLASRAVSAVEVTTYALARIERLDGRKGLNAFILVAAEEALRDAHASDARRTAGAIRGLLDGVPVAVKDLCDMAGHPTTGGSPVFADRIADRDSTVVARLREAGAVVLGKTNLMEFGYGHPNDAYGETRNPWDTIRTAGGSSGGSAAAVAAGMVWGAIGSDTGGSIRSPAAYCGVSGLKPTYGLVSCSGVIPLSWSLDHLGPIARSAADCAAILAAVAGHDETDPSSARSSDANRVLDQLSDVALLDGESPVRLGIVPRMFELSVTPGLRDAVEAQLHIFADAGMSLIEVDMDQALLDELVPAIYSIYSVEAAAYHRRTTHGKWGLMNDTLREGLERALDVPGVDYVDAMRTRIELGRAFNALYEQVDLLVWPAQPLTGPLLGTTAAEVEGTHADTIEVEIAATAAANLLGEPAIAIPCGFVDGLPVGVQLQGPQFSDQLVLAAAAAYQREAGPAPLPDLG